MEAWLPGLLAVAGSYLLGSIPFGLLLARWVAGVDVRTVGSGNVGATNVGRVLGHKGFAVVLVLDAVKGAIPVLVLAPLTATDPSQLDLLRALCALFAVLGHVFSVFLRFRGGKGVATTLGAIVALSPLAALATLIVFLLVIVAFRIVSLASVAAAVAFPFAVYFVGGSRESLGFAALVALLVIVRHRSNLIRIAQGTEPRGFGRDRKEGDPTPEEAQGG